MGLKGWSQTSVCLVSELLLYLVSKGFQAAEEVARTKVLSFIVHFPALSADVSVYLLSLGHFQSYQAETGTKSCTSPHSAIIPALAKSCLVSVFTSEWHEVYNAQSPPKVLKQSWRFWGWFDPAVVWIANENRLLIITTGWPVYNSCSHGAKLDEVSTCEWRW